MSHEAVGKSDEWYTPDYVFQGLGVTFDMDVAPARFGTSYVPRSVDLVDGLVDEWRGFVWMNPPFGGRNGLVPWLDRFFDHGNGIALTPDRTSAPWWQDAASKCDALLLMTPKVRFIRPCGSQGVSPANGTTLFASGDFAADVLSKSPLGLCFKTFIGAGV